MLTAAVRDLHTQYPGKFVTDVRTHYPALWLNNPFITPLADDEADVRVLNCWYPLIKEANRSLDHCLHGFVDFFNDRLNLRIRLGSPRGDIHISEQERAWYSQVRELTRMDIPFWIIDAGGKYDITIKWWASSRFQTVVDYFRGRLQFVQVGAAGHHHPKLDGVIDLRGKTDIRQLVRLVYHAQGVLCPVTGLMHLAAAVPGKGIAPKHRPCVVIAGGREPQRWEEYPGHQFIHLAGALKCCGSGGCWKDRTTRLRDGDERDRSERLCEDVSNGNPRCMELISAEEVIGRIELYFNNPRLRYLTRRQNAAAERGIRASKRSNRYDSQPLNLHNAGTACDRFVAGLKATDEQFAGRGIVICGGGARYFPSAWVCINMLRSLGCRLPIELWHIGPKELDQKMSELLKPLNVECVDAGKVLRKAPMRQFGGWQMKAFSLLYSRFKEVLLLDADNVPVTDPEYLFEASEFRKSGAVFWPDYNRGANKNGRKIWRSCGLRTPSEYEFESGQILLDKARCGNALRLAVWFNENSDFYYRYLHGDKETFHLAFRKLKQPYVLVRHPIHPLQATMCQHDFAGNRIFQHRNLDKWDILGGNRRIRDFLYEDECLAFLNDLRNRWDGGIGLVSQRYTFSSIRQIPAPRIAAVMITCPERDSVCATTLTALRSTDWGMEAVHVEVDRSRDGDFCRRQTRCALRALRHGLTMDADYLLFLEDDLEFNRFFSYNLICWPPLQRNTLTLASLYNPQIRPIACDLSCHARVVEAASIFGSQAFLLSRNAAKYVVTNWHRVPGMQDIKISRLAARLRKPILYHTPSLVQHRAVPSVWGGRNHRAVDFDADWKAL